MATTTKKTAAKPRAAATNKDAPQNTSAPATPGTRVEVSATVAAGASSPVATQAATDATAGNLSASDGEDASPNGGEDELVAHSVMVIARVDGFRRAGRVWGKTPITIPIDELSDDQIQALLLEPKLSVAFVADEGEPC